MSKAISRRDFLKVTGAVGAAGLLAACGGNGGSNDAQQGTVGEHALEHLANVHLAVVGGHIHTLTHQVKAEQVAEDGTDRENACNDGHAAAGEDRLARVLPMVRQVDSSARSLGSAEMAEAMDP